MMFFSLFSKLQPHKKTIKKKKKLLGIKIIYRQSLQRFAFLT